jgi:hypothetical protein
MRVRAWRGGRVVPSNEWNLTPAARRRKARRQGFRASNSVGAGAYSALSIICASWPLLTAPIWVASTLPFLNTIKVGMPRTP